MTRMASAHADAGGLHALPLAERERGSDERHHQRVVVAAAREVHRDQGVPADERRGERPPSRDEPGRREHATARRRPERATLRAAATSSAPTGREASENAGP